MQKPVSMHMSYTLLTLNLAYTCLSWSFPFLDQNIDLGMGKTKKDKCCSHLSFLVFPILRSEYWNGKGIGNS